ncbi:hypothetical protein [Bradyrhizobium sp.]|uniref:hypothetical protein n=1 Tax=Bradyrhizobium sp. TaxID=376 RepID=UPI003C4D83DD
MDYEPWPETGCSLAEARERTADRVLVGQSVEGAGRNQPTEIKTMEERIEAACLDHLKCGRLIAYGRQGSLNADLQLISAAQWNALTNIEWQNSSSADDRLARSAFLDIRVYPPLLAPCHIDLLAGRTLAEAFEQFVLGDPEVATLAREAVRLSSEFEAVFVRGCCHVYGFKEWPLAFERSVMVSTVHPDEAKRSIYDGAGEPDPLEVVIAAEALKHRYCILISILRRGELEGRGLPVTAGHSEVILRSIWSHEDFHFGANTGDVLQDNPESTGRHDRLIRRWIGVVLQRSNSSDQRIHPLGKVFHGKPPVHDELLSTTSVLQAAPVQRSKAVARVETKVASRMACEAWLKGIMAESQNRRTFTAEELWARAQKKWRGTLSERQFLAARGEAIRATRAFAWGAGGAPKKPRR